MYVERVLSFNNAWSLLTTNKHSEWQDITDALAKFTIESIQEHVATNDSTNEDSITYYLNIYYNEYIRNTGGWEDSLPRHSGIRTDLFEDHLIKNGLSSYIASSKDLPSGGFLNNFYLIMPHYHKLGELEAFVVLAPTTETKSQFISSGINQIASLLSEADCRAELAQFGPLISHIPTAIAFYSSTSPETITVEEVAPLKIGETTIERNIEFAPEYYQAGVGLLSYFGEVLRQKDPNTKAKVRIEQDGNTVRLHIVPPVGKAEVVEKQLEQFALVISHQAPPEILFENRIHIMQLESRLEVAKVELKNAHDLKQLTDGIYSHQVRSLQQQVDSLTQQVAAQLLQQGQFIQLVAQQTNSHERMQAALLAHSQILFKDLLQEASGNQQLAEAVSSLQHNLLSGMAIIDVEDKLEQALATIKETKPGFLGRILKELEGAAYKASASSTVTWVATWIAAHA